MSPRTTTSWRLVSSPSQSPWPTHSSPSNGSSRMWITMTPRSRRCFIKNAHRVHVYHSQREGLSVGQSSSSVSERTGRPVEERTGRPVMVSGQELNVGNAPDRKSESSPNVRRRLRNTIFRLIMTEEVYENWMKLLSLSRKKFIAFKQKNFNDEINNFLMNS